MLICIAGLPGSGKTHLAFQYKTKGFEIIDDINVIDPLFNLLSRKKNVVVTDPNFCVEKVRQAVKDVIKKNFPSLKIKWIFFENDAEKAINNVKYRQKRGDNRKVEGLIRFYKEIYTIPEKAKSRKIWQSSKKEMK